MGLVPTTVNGPGLGLCALAAVVIRCPSLTRCLMPRVSHFVRSWYTGHASPEACCKTGGVPITGCRGQTQVPNYQVRTWNAHTATLAFSQRGSSLRWGLQGKVTRTLHQRTGGHGTVCEGDLFDGEEEVRLQGLRVQGQSVPAAGGEQLTPVTLPAPPP